MRILPTRVGGQVGSALVARLPGIGSVIPVDVDTLDFAGPDPLAATNALAQEMS
jgi:hypothetical protein